MIPLLAALLGCLALSRGQARASEAGAALTPDMVFTTPEQPAGEQSNGKAAAMLAPNTAINDTAAVGPPLESVLSAQACSSACRATPKCQLFKWCGVTDGCPTAKLDFQQCQLLALPACTLQPTIQQTGWPVVTTTGFPARQAPQAVSGFTEEPGHGIIGADFSCPLSVLPGKCAYRRLLDAATMCVDAVNECRAVVWYFNGTDGCSEPVGVLKHDGLAPLNTYVAPGVTTLQQAEDLPAVSSRLYLDDGEAVLPSEQEEARAAAEAGSGGAHGNDTTWRGCFIGRHAIMDGDVVGVLDGVPSAEACCRACRALVNASVPTCNAFTYCNQTEGCSYTEMDRGQSLTLAASQCELRWQSLTPVGWPPTLVAKGPDVPFYGGAPIAVWGPEQEGYTRYLGFGLFTYGRYNCSGSLQPQLQECVLSGSMQSLVQHCEADDECVGFVLKPGGLFTTAPNVGIFKHATDPSKILFNPTGVLYLRQDTGGGLSAGAIAGIAVGAAAGVAALACAAWMLVRRRRRRRAADALPGKAGVEGGSVSTGPWPECDPGSPAYQQQQQQQHVELQPAEQQQVQSVWLAPAPSGMLASAASALGSTAPIAELVQHVAAQDHLAVGMGMGGAGSGSGTASGGSSAGGGLHVPVCAETLPARLREWVVDPAEVHYCRWPNGRLQELGAGASAHVYKALFHGELIAAKEIDIGRSPSMQEAFLTEALRLHELRHANVVSFFGVTFKRDASAAPDSALKGVVLMEYAEGRDLHSALELCAAGTDQRLFGWYRRGRRVAYDVAKAMNYLHSKSVVHMDIKSSNVLLTASGTAKLGDVAFSRVQHNTYLSDLPLVGTFAWVAPEVLLGGRQCTSAVDLYSFGIVLWEIVTGLRPQRGCIRSPLVPEECPQEVADLVDACLSQDPAERPTATEALRQLGVLLGPRGAPAGGPPRQGGEAALQQ
ncbi:Serine threonine-kinase CTR1 [Micractinium conductrix]|uniref:non-specific serine/threonine protein kinase n=1 Tax=Micractinium conductrix TaxID=554055 RepID=A0A2P6VHH0_9CHLO|nr:Serine threonine-kinase CTR1 [Micractinium conductrix]|eukprot:PSC73546.1 Serine threonine-kinase CTR1 [Micractinium conductrix]